MVRINRKKDHFMTAVTPIGIFGFGVVGQGLYDILQQYPRLNLSVKQIGVKDPQKARPLPEEAFTFDRQSIIQDPKIPLIVELTNDEEEGFAIVKEALLAGKQVVSANKKMIAQNLGALIELQRKQSQTLLYEGAVCGSIPVIRTLEDYFTHEPVQSLHGIFNGSSNYILSKIFNEQLDYRTALEQAQEKGYAEADPTLDVGGYDAKYKLAIAASHAFGITVDPNSVATLGIHNLSSFDENQARQRGQKLKLLAKAVDTGNGQISLLVVPEFIQETNRLYTVDEEYNAALIEAPYSGSHTLIGQGAGAYPTGAAVLADILAARSGYQYQYRKTQLNTPYVHNQSAELTIYLGFRERSALDQLPLETLDREVQGLERGAAIGRIKASDLIRYKAWLDEQEIFVATIPSEASEARAEDEVSRAADQPV